MRLAEFMFERLSNDAGVSALVDSRIYPMRIPEKEPWPVVTFHRVDADRTYTYEPYEDTTPWLDARVQVNCWAWTFDEADELGDAVLLALSGYFDDEFTVFALNDFDTYEPEPKKFRRIVDFRVSHEEILTAS